MPSEQQSQLPTIRCAEVYPLDREQWTGYCTAYLEVGAPPERVSFISLAGGLPKPHLGGPVRSVQSDPESAWKAFDLGLRDWLKDHPGVVLWRMEPTLQSFVERVVDDLVVPKWLEGPGVAATFETPHARYYVFARIAVTENRDFLDPDKIGPHHLPTHLPLVGEAA